MQEQQRTTWEYMLHYGALLGIFWIFQYLFFIGQTYWVHFIYFYHLLNIGSPLLMYIFYLKYREQTPDLKHNLWRCVLFVTGICLLGSVFDAAIRYAHYAFIDPNYFANLSAVGIGIAESWLRVMDENGAFNSISSDQVATMKDQYITIMQSKTPYIISEIISRAFLGFMFSFLIALLTRNRINKTN